MDREKEIFDCERLLARVSENRTFWPQVPFAPLFGLTAGALLRPAPFSSSPPHIPPRPIESHSLAPDIRWALARPVASVPILSIAYVHQRSTII
jgi:hypothetical protein